MVLKYLKNVTSLSLAAEQCNGCGTCRLVCPRCVFALTAGKAEIRDKDLCIECGACATNCPTGAIEVKAGTGCASAIMRGWITKSEPCCDDGGEGCC
jgi:NAD-dependent dihydropyrimidine dehydrogenase PreA subunit